MKRSNACILCVVFGDCDCFFVAIVFDVFFGVVDVVFVVFVFFLGSIFFCCLFVFFLLDDVGTALKFVFLFPVLFVFLFVFLTSRSRLDHLRDVCRFFAVLFFLDDRLDDLDAFLEDEVFGFCDFSAVSVFILGLGGMSRILC